MRLTFKVDDRGLTYALRLVGSSYASSFYGKDSFGTGSERIYQEGNPASVVLYPHQKEIDVTVTNLKPDNNGCITICCERIGHGDTINIMDLEVNGQ